jgi:hypothetical protein
MTQHSYSEREKPFEAMSKVIAEVRKNYPSSVDVKTLKERLDLPDRTVDYCIKRGISLRLFTRSDRGTYVWIPFDEDIRKNVEQALKELRSLFRCFNIPIEEISTHQLVRRSPEQIREILCDLRWRDPTVKEVDDFQRSKHDLAMRASYWKYEGCPRNIGDIPKYQIIKQEGDTIVRKEIPYPKELIDRVKRFIELYPERVGKTLDEIMEK